MWVNDAYMSIIINVRERPKNASPFSRYYLSSCHNCEDYTFKINSNCSLYLVADLLIEKVSTSLLGKGNARNASIVIILRWQFEPF